MKNGILSSLLFEQEWKILYKNFDNNSHFTVLRANKNNRSEFVCELECPVEVSDYSKSRKSVLSQITKKCTIAAELSLRYLASLCGTC